MSTPMDYGPHEREVDLFGADPPHKLTVQQAEEPAARHKREKIRQPKKALNGFKVDPRVMTAARELAGGNMRRIEIVSETEVIVR